MSSSIQNWVFIHNARASLLQNLNCEKCVQQLQEVIKVHDSHDILLEE